MFRRYLSVANWRPAADSNSVPGSCLCASTLSSKLLGIRPELFLYPQTSILFQVIAPISCSFDLSALAEERRNVYVLGTKLPLQKPLLVLELTWRCTTYHDTARHGVLLEPPAYQWCSRVQGRGQRFTLPPVKERLHLNVHKRAQDLA